MGVCKVELSGLTLNPEESRDIVDMLNSQLSLREKELSELKKVAVSGLILVDKKIRCINCGATKIKYEDCEYCGT
jgi:hypothetical protein